MGMVLRWLVHGIVALVLLVLLLGGGALGVLMFAPGLAEGVVRSQVAAALKGTGFDVEFDRMVYAPVGGLTLYGIRLLDAQGVVAKLDRVTLDVDYKELMALQLNARVEGKTLRVLRAPVERQGDSGEVVAGFVMPDLVFERIVLERLAFERVEIQEPVVGMAMRFKPELEARAVLGNEAGISVIGTLGPEVGASGTVVLPDAVEVVGRLRSTDLMVVVETLRVGAAAYEVSGSGVGSWVGEGVLDYTAEVVAKDAMAVTGGEVASGTLVVRLTGTAARGVVTAEGEVTPGRVREVLAPVKVTAVADDVFAAVSGTVRVTSRYEDVPVEVEGRFAYGDSQLRVTEVSGTAPGVTLWGNGMVDTDAEVVDGSMELRVADVARYAKLLGEDVGGQVVVKGMLAGEGSAQRVDAEVLLTNGRYEDVRLKRLAGTVRFGDVVTSPWPEMVDVQVQELQLAEDAVLKSGKVGLQRKDGEVYGLTVGGKGWTGVPVTFAGTATVRDIASGWPTVEGIVLDGLVRRSKIGLRGMVGREVLELKATTDKLQLGDLPVGEMPEGLQRVLVSGEVRMVGSLSKPVTEGTVRMLEPAAEGYASLLVNGTFKHDGQMVTVDAVGKGQGVKTLTAQARVPVGLGVYPFKLEMDENAALAGKVRAALDVGVIGRLVLPSSQVMSGAVDTDLTLGGTLASPQIDGPVTLRNGRFVDEENGIVLAGLRADGRLMQDRVVLSEVRGGDGEAGRLSGQGVIGFGVDEATNVAVTFEKMHIPRTSLANGFIDGRLKLADARDGYMVTGQIDVRTLNILIPDTFEQRIPELNVVRRGEDAEVPVPVGLAIQLNAPKEVYVRGWGLDAEFGGALNIAGTIDAPVINGTLASSRGRYSEFGQRFTLERANLQFMGAVPPSPYLDVAASTRRGEITANIAITGAFGDPVFAFTSIPSLPQDEVLSHLLFGEGIGGITPFQAVQLAQTLQRLSGRKSGVGFDPIGTIRNVTGLDDIDIETNESGETTVGAGKYLTDKVYLEVEQGSGEGTGAANIQIELTPRVNVKSRVGQQEGVGGGVFWKRDY